MPQTGGVRPWRLSNNEVLDAKLADTHQVLASHRVLPKDPLVDREGLLILPVDVLQDHPSGCEDLLEVAHKVLAAARRWHQHRALERVYEHQVIPLSARCVHRDNIQAIALLNFVHPGLQSQAEESRGGVDDARVKLHTADLRAPRAVREGKLREGAPA